MTTYTNSTLRVSSDRSLLDVPEVYSHLRDMYWAASLTYEKFERAVANSAVVVGAYEEVPEGMGGVAPKTGLRVANHSVARQASFEDKLDADNKIGTAGSTRKLVGFARVISDCATFAYLTDVFVVDGYRGRGVSKQMMQHIADHPDLQELRRFLLVTRDAQGLYAQFGFEPLDNPDKWMQIFNR